MIQRCTLKTWRDYHNYGGRGITVAKEWVESFDAFLKSVGVRPSSKHSLDRIDNSRGYEPGNVRWSTWIQQANNRRNNRLLTFQGKTQSVRQWERQLGFKPPMLSQRLRKGWSIERALTEPRHVQRRFIKPINGFSRPGLEYRIRVLGWSLEKASTEPRLRTRLRVNRATSKSLVNPAKQVM